MGASSQPAADQTPSALQLRVRILEMSSVFAELSEHFLDDIGVERGTIGRSRADIRRIIQRLWIGAQGGRH